jgi:hypothetical protein
MRTSALFAVLSCTCRRLVRSRPIQRDRCQPMFGQAPPWPSWTGAVVGARGHPRRRSRSQRPVASVTALDRIGWGQPSLPQRLGVGRGRWTLRPTDTACDALIPLARGNPVGEEERCLRPPAPW